jgi:6-phosphogluconate dehydrogenase
VIDSLVPLLEQGDIIIDGGNAKWTTPSAASAALAPKGLRFIGSGVSGGEEGARFGPSLMPGGDPKPGRSLKPIWNAIAAKVDAEDRQAARKAPSPASPSPAACPAPPTSARTAPATT